MKWMFLLVIFMVSIPYAECVLGVDVSQLFSTSTYQCMKSNGYSFAIIRAYRSYGALDPDAKQGLTNAKNAGLITDVYLFPCRGKSATSQVDEMMNAIPANLYGMIWIDVETNPSSGCSWKSYSASSNCQYVSDLINRIKSKGKHAGVYASEYMWETIMGSVSACTNVASSSQLWYAHYDGKATFSDYLKIGGWSKPNIKQYQGDTTLCGASVDKNYYP